MKKIISFILSLVLIITICCFHANAHVVSMRDTIIRRHFTAYREAGKYDIAAEKPELILGDATIDGTVDATDALFALIYGLDMSFDETVCSVGKKASDINPYYYGLDHPPAPGSYGRLDKQIMERDYNRYIVGGGDPQYFSGHLWYYKFNSALVADVSNDGFSNAVDAMLILQYAVGKIDAFPRTDFSSKGNMFYVPWSDEWEPGMLWNEDIKEKTDSGYYSAFQ